MNFAAWPAMLDVDVDGNGTNPPDPVVVAALPVRDGRPDKSTAGWWLTRPNRPVTPFATRVHGPPCTNSPCAPDSAKANSLASTGKTSTSPPERPASGAHSSALAPAASRTSPPRPGPPSAASRSRPNASIPSRSTRNARTGSERQQDRTGATAGFTTPTGRPLDPANLTRRFRSFLDRAGLRRIRFHDLRHSTATLLLEQGVDLVVIKELLGHAHIGVTAGVYAHVRLRLQRQAIDALGDALGAQDDDPDDPPATAVVR